MPGVLLVLTGEDVKADGLGDVPCHAPLNNKDGSPRHDTPRPALAIGKVRHLGQPVAVVVAETLPQAQDAAEAIEIDYEELPAVADARAALEKGAPQLFDGIPGNLVFDWDNDTSDFAATDAAFAKAAHVTTLEMINNRVVCNSMEPRNAIGDWDAAAGRPVLYTGTQGSHFVRDPLAEAVLKVPKEKLRVVTPPNVGGGFGMKAFVYPEQVLVVWAAEKLKRPVRWQSDRSEAFLSDNQGRDHFTRAELAMDEKGKFLGLRVSLIANVGAYLSPMGPFIPTRSTDLISGLYTTPAIAINVKGVCTNTVPVCAYRGAGRPEASYLIERLVDAAAREMDMTPDRIRRINLIPKKAIPYTSPTKLMFDSGEFVEIMQAAMEKADWTGFKARRRESQKRGKLRGIGMATYTERCGGGFPETASIEFKGDRVDLVMGNQEYGTGLVTSYKQLVSDRLGIDADRIDVVYGDSDRRPRGLTGGSRALPVGGSALHEASLKIIDKGKQIAANLLEAPPATSSSATGNSASSAPTGRSICSTSRRPRRIPRSCRPAWSRGSTTRRCRTRPARRSPTAAISPRSRSTPTAASPRSCATRSSTTSATSSIRCCWKGRCTAASCRASGRRCGRDRLRRQRPASDRHVHGLRDAARRQPAELLVLDPQCALHGEPARHQGRGRGRRDRRTAGADQRDRGRAAPQRRASHRHAGDAFACVAGAARSGLGQRSH